MCSHGHQGCRVPGLGLSRVGSSWLALSGLFLTVHGNNHNRASLGQCAFRDTVSGGRGFVQRQEMGEEEIEKWREIRGKTESRSPPSAILLSMHWKVNSCYMFCASFPHTTQRAAAPGCRDC